MLPSSHRYWSSRELNLKLKRSAIDGGLRFLIALALVTALVLIYQRGYPLLAAASAVYALLCLLWRRSVKLRALRCRAGQWQADLAAYGWREITFKQPVHCHAYLVLLRWQPVGSSTWHLLCLWPDSAAPEALRQLRKRLRLQSA